VTALKATLPDDWSERVATAFDGKWWPDASGVVSVTLIGGPDGDVVTTWQLSEGALTVVAPAPGDAPLALQVPWADAVATFSGKAEPAVLYMQGKLKTSGDNALLLRVLKAASTPEFAEWRTKAAIITNA